MPNLLVHLFLPHESNNQRAKILHPSSLSLLLVVLVAFQLVIGRVASTYPRILGYASQISPDEIVRLTNLRRQENGLGSLQIDPELTAAAARKAADMYAKNYWAHVAPDGTQPWYFITDSGYAYRYAGENLARDFSDPDAVVTAWMDSPTHRENLLSVRYSEIGVAVVDGTLDGRETTLVVQMFGTRLAATPTVSSQKTAAVPVVKAAAEPSSSPQIIQPPPAISSPVVAASTSPFDVTKTVSLALLGLFVVVLVVDLIVVHRRKITRWTSKSLAHLALMLFLLAAAVLVNRGVIL